MPGRGCVHHGTDDRRPRRPGPRLVLTGASGSRPTSVAGALLRGLGEAGARTVFGLPGAHNWSFWEAKGAALPRLVNVRHEQAAVFAADGWARASGALGAAVVTTGPGAANTLAAFGEAAMSGSPVVLVASEVPSRPSGDGVPRTLHQSRDQASMFASLAKGIFQPRSPGRAMQDLGRAIAVALAAPRGPVYIDVPADILKAPAPADCHGGARTEPCTAPLDHEALGQAVSILDSGRTVAIWVGGGAVSAGADREVAALAEHFQAPVVTTFSARGIVGERVPYDVVLPPHEPEVEDLLASADVLLALGTDFDGMMTKNAGLRLPRTIIDINVELSRMSFGYEGVLPVLADVRTAAQHLLGATAARTSGLAAAVPVLRDKVWARLGSDPRAAEAVRFVNSVQRAAAGRAIVVNDMAVAGYWLGNYYRPTASRRVQYPVGWGTLGYAVPASVGAAFAGAQPVLGVCGDGGFMYAVGELATIAQEKLPVSVLLVNDNGYGMLRYGHVGPGARAPGADLETPDFVRLAESFGVAAAKVDDVGASLEQALRRRLSSGEPGVVVCDAALLPPKTTSPRWTEP